MADLTPELLAQLDAIDGQPYNCEWREEYVQDRNESIICDAHEEKEAGMIIAALNALPALVAAAKERDQLRTALEMLQPGVDDLRRMSDEMEQLCQAHSAALSQVVAERDQLREAARLRDYATMEAWSGAATGLEAAALATAQAEALEKLAGVVAPTAEQQRDSAFAKVATLMAERIRLRAEVERLRGLGLEAVRFSRSSPRTINRVATWF